MIHSKMDHFLSYGMDINIQYIYTADSSTKNLFDRLKIRLQKKIFRLVKSSGRPDGPDLWIELTVEIYWQVRFRPVKAENTRLYIGRIWDVLDEKTR